MCIFSYHSFLLPLNFLRDDTSASVIQPLSTDTVQGEVAADKIQPPPSPPISPAHSPQIGQASTSKVISNSNDSRNDKDDHAADPLAQFYGKARAQQKLKEDGVSFKSLLVFQLLLIDVLTSGQVLASLISTIRMKGRLITSYHIPSQKE